VISAIEREIMKKFDNQVWLQPNKVQLTIFPKQVNLLEEILKTLNDMIPEKERGNIKIFVPEDSIDLIPANIDKGVAVKKLRDILNIDKDYVISVGDDENDIPMLIESGISISIGDKIKHYNPTHNFECVLDAIAFIKKVVTHE
ncbi:MAG: HAD family hydrolase, partial [Candidatus Asgardarchaeia archaeon]